MATMANVIIDPTNHNVALADGEVVHAIRIVTIADPNRPTVSELSDGRIIGYGRFN